MKWSVISGTEVVTVANNVLEAKGVGEAVIKVSYKDEQTVHATTMRVTVAAGT